MPSDNKVLHPLDNSLEIIFKEVDHSYKDSRGGKYISVTTLISEAFEKFDSDGIAEKTAIKRGVSKESLLKEWSEKGKNAARIGTRLHWNMEQYIHNKFDLMWKPEDVNEKIRFDSAIKILEKIKEKYKPEWMEPEKLVFSPSFGIAGSIDLLVKINDEVYIIFDWKCLSKDIEKYGYNGKCGIILPTLCIPDSNYWHYALQLQIYENLLKSEEYIKPLANVKKILIVWNGHKFSMESIDYIPEAWALMAWKNKLI